MSEEQQEVLGQRRVSLGQDLLGAREHLPGQRLVGLVVHPAVDHGFEVSKGLDQVRPGGLRQHDGGHDPAQSSRSLSAGAAPRQTRTTPASSPGPFPPTPS